MNFPATSDELKRGNYMYASEGTCRGCGAKIEFWITPKGKYMPMSVKRAGDALTNSGYVREPHFVDCPNAKDFRK